MDKWVVGLGVVLLFLSIIPIAISFSSDLDGITELAPAGPIGNPRMNSTSWSCDAYFNKNETVCLYLNTHINWSKLVDVDRTKTFYIMITGPHNGNFTYVLTYMVPEGEFRLVTTNLTLERYNGDEIEWPKNYDVAQASRAAGYTIVAGITKYAGLYRATILWEDTYPPVGYYDMPSEIAFYRGYLIETHPYTSWLYVGVVLVPVGTVLTYYGVRSGKKKRREHA